MQVIDLEGFEGEDWRRREEGCRIFRTGEKGVSSDAEDK